MSLILRYMIPEDIPQVVNIDRVSFSTPWSARSYAYEIAQSNYSYMVVLEHIMPQPLPGWKKLLRNISGNGNTPDLEGSNGTNGTNGTKDTEESTPLDASDRQLQRRILGYGGLWHIMDEAHISTIATHPEARGRGYGELLLAAMMRRAITLKADYIVLEVRVSNTVAQNLYKKYEFTTVDTKKRYYRDNGEDAYDMRFTLDRQDAIQRFDGRFDAVKGRIPFSDHYTETQRPRQLT